jgi:hypothetical protein
LGSVEYTTRSPTARAPTGGRRRARQLLRAPRGPWERRSPWGERWRRGPIRRAGVTAAHADGPRRVVAGRTRAAAATHQRVSPLSELRAHGEGRWERGGRQRRQSRSARPPGHAGANPVGCAARPRVRRALLRGVPLRRTVSEPGMLLSPYQPVLRSRTRKLIRSSAALTVLRR